MESAGFKIRVRCCTPLPSPPLYPLTPALQALEREAEKIQKEEARPAEANTHHSTCMCTRTIQITHPYHIYIYMLSRLHGPRAPTACSQQHRTSPRSRRFQCQSEVGYPSLSLSPSQSLGLLSLALRLSFAYHPSLFLRLRTHSWMPARVGRRTRTRTWQRMMRTS